MLHFLAEESSTNGWDAVVLLGLFAFVGFFLWLVFR